VSGHFRPPPGVHTDVTPVHADVTVAVWTLPHDDDQEATVTDLVQQSRPTAFAVLDALLARSATTNAACALQDEAERRLAWRYEESEYLLLSAMTEVPATA
jgi:hypothetical protein